MKKRILFVDDEPFVLHGLQRMLRHLRNEWEMEFFESPFKALGRILKAPVDVVVADMVMPGLNGAQLLEETRKRHPGSVRLILSGRADQSLVMKCVGVAHQYLAKPCETEGLEAAIRRATGTSLENEKIRTLVARLDRVPSIPAVYAEVNCKLQTPEVAVEEIGEIIARDIGMTATILKLVNSAFFGLPQEVANPVEAVTFLGLDTIKSLVLFINAFSQFESTTLGGLTLDALWKHSLATATAARQIARAENCDRKRREEAFVGGLLHDTGKLILASNFSSQYAEAVGLARQNRGPLFAAERDVFGITHADVGGYLLGLWGLPVPVVEAIALHHSPRVNPGKILTALTAVHAADVLVQERRSAIEDIIPPQFDAPYLNELGLAQHLEQWRNAVNESPSSGEVI